MITASQIRDYVACPHRITMDAFGNPADRDEPNSFVEMLWENGIEHEAAVAASLGITADMSAVSLADRERETRAAMARGEPLIYRGHLTVAGLVGEPDLLEKRGSGYIAGDIKSGGGLEGEDEDGGKGRIKKDYAYQVAHYENILQQSGLSDGSRESFIIDRDALRVPYPLMEPQGVRTPQTWWDGYLAVLAEVEAILAKSNTSKPAMAAPCKLCHWYSACRRDLIAAADLTLVCELGRTKRDAMCVALPTIHALATCDPDEFVRGKKTDFPSVSPDSLRKYHARAKLLVTPGAKPYIREPIHLPIMAKECFFDVEDDPVRGSFLYLCGFVERLYGRPETAVFLPQFADGFDAASEEGVFRRSWAYLLERSVDSAIYYYSKYERTTLRRMAQRYPSVCTVEQVNDLFGLPNVIDLYTDVVKKTEWPTYDKSIKTLAKYLGFSWRDSHPSGAASIQWFHEWTEKRDPAVKTRILEYNHDDCLATGILVDGIRTVIEQGQSGVAGRNPA